MSLSASIFPESPLINRSKNYIKTIMNNVKNNKKYNLLVNPTNKSLQNTEQNNPKRQSISSGISLKNNTEKISIINNKKTEININQFQKEITIPFEKITYDSYFESNLLSLLYYFRSYIYNIKIVCHSHVMQDLLNIQILEKFSNIDISIKNKILEIENNENIWSILLNSGKYCITRHAFTIANFHKENAKNSYFGKLSFGKFKQVTDYDTKLSLYGILGTLDFNNSSINLKDCNNTVFVSILVRTWITAICLYLPKIEENKQFTLIVSPFIKESGITYDNTPLSIDKQINIIKNFLLFLRNIDTSKVTPNCNSSIQVINNFFNNGGELVINGEKIVISGKNKLFRNIKHIKNIKYTIKYDTSNKCFVIIQSNINNFFKELIRNTNTSSNHNLDIRHLKIVPGLRKPTLDMIKKTIINQEPLNKSKIINIINCVSNKNKNKNINIGIIDIDEEGKEFTSDEVKMFYLKNKNKLQPLNILVVCTQRSLSQGSTKHFQHLLKELFIETNNTNFNLKNKKNTTQAIPFKTFSAISGSNTGLRTRVYTQGLDNNKLDVKFDSVDFSSTSSNEGAILCSIKYNGNNLIKVLNSYLIDVTDEKRQNIINKMTNKKALYSRNTIFIGKLNYKYFYTNTAKIHDGINLIKTTATNIAKIKNNENIKSNFYQTVGIGNIE